MDKKSKHNLHRQTICRFLLLIIGTTFLLIHIKIQTLLGIELGQIQYLSFLYEEFEHNDLCKN